MSNLTEQEGLRKLLSVEQFNRQTHVEQEPGIVGRLVKWLFGGTKETSDKKSSRKLTDQDVQVLRELEHGTEVGLRREEWDDYRVMIVDQRLRVYPVSGITALTQEMNEINLDINIAYKVFDVNYVAFGVDDPLALLQNAVIERALDQIRDITLKDVSRRSSDIAKEIEQIGRMVESGLEVIDARVNILLPNELVDKITRTNRVIQDAESMLIEREANAKVQERTDKIDFDTEIRKIQNQEHIQRLKDQFQQEADLKLIDHEGLTSEKKDQYQQKSEVTRVDHETLITRKKEDLKREQEMANEKHRLSILREQFSTFTEMLRGVGINPKLAIMMMTGDNWQLFFKNFKGLAEVGEEHRGQQLEAIHGHINDLITTKQLSEDNIQKLLGYIQEEAKHLGQSPSIMKQFEVFLENPDSKPQLEDQSIKDDKTTIDGKFVGTIDESPNRSIGDVVGGDASTNDDNSKSYPARSDLSTEPNNPE